MNGLPATKKPPTPATFGLAEGEAERVEAIGRAHEQSVSRYDPTRMLGWTLFLIVVGGASAIAIATQSAAPILFLYPASVVAFIITTRGRRGLAESLKARKRRVDPYGPAGISPERVRAVAALREAEALWNRQDQERQASHRATTERLRQDDAERRERADRARRDYWRSLSGSQFEEEIARLYRAQGYEVEETPATRDGGVDLFLRRADEFIVVQCKQQSTPAEPHFARDLFGTMHHNVAHGAILVCTSGFSEQAVAFAQAKPIKLIDLDEVIRMNGEPDSEWEVEVVK